MAAEFNSNVASRVTNTCLCIEKNVNIPPKKYKSGSCPVVVRGGTPLNIKASH